MMYSGKYGEIVTVVNTLFNYFIRNKVTAEKI